MSDGRHGRVVGGTPRGFLLIFTGALLVLAVAPRPARPQYANNPYRNYSTNPFVNSNLKLSFQRSWRANHLRLLGRGEVADRMEGRGGRSSAPTPRAQTTPDAREQELLRQLNDVLAGLDEFKRLGARERQEVYEAAVISGGFVIALLQQAREENNAAKAEQAKQLAGELLKDLFGEASA